MYVIILSKSGNTKPPALDDRTWSLMCRCELKLSESDPDWTYDDIHACLSYCSRWSMTRCVFFSLLGSVPTGTTVIFGVTPILDLNRSLI